MKEITKYTVRAKLVNSTVMPNTANTLLESTVLSYRKSNVRVVINYAE